MNFMLQDLVQGTLASLCFALFLLPPGYLFARATGLLSLPLRPLTEQVRWALLLSLPLSLLFTSLGPRLIPASAVNLLFLVAATVAAILFARALPRPFSPRSLRTPALLGLGLLLYTLFVTSSLQFGHALFEGVHVADWSVRIPLVADLVRSPALPSNPFFTVHSIPQPAHFYFFWYSLVAAVARLAHLPARAALSGSVLWSALALVALLSLLLEHLAGIRLRLRSHILFALALCCVMGVDILPTLGGLLTHPIHLTPEIEWWHDDRIPSFLGAIVFAPHHIAGLVCGTTAFLLLTPARHPDPPPPLPQTLLLALTAGLCFAATVGTSTYLALCFGFVGLFFVLTQLPGLSPIHRRNTLLALALSTLLAVVLSLPVLHTLLGAPAAPIAGLPPHRFPLSLTLRELGDGDRMVLFLSKRLHHPVHARPLQHLLALPLVALYIPLEFGFFLVPLALQIRQDLRRLRSPHPGFTPGERTLWALFLGALLPALFLSSAPTQGINDLGRHAGLLLRLVTIVWSTRLLFPCLDRLRRRQLLAPAHPWLVRASVLLLALGLLSQLWQITLDRLFLPLFHHTGQNPEMPFAKDARLGDRYFDLRSGLSALESTLPPTAIVQGNPGSRFGNITTLYSHLPFAAADPSCEIAFGGDPALCRPTVLELQALFGGPPDVQPHPLGPYVTVTAPDAPQTTTPAAFLQACQDLHLAALVAQNSDPAWSLPQSWVWHEPAAFSTPRVRILPCPTKP